MHKISFTPGLSFSLGRIEIASTPRDASIMLAKTGQTLLLVDHRHLSPPERGGSGARREAAKLILSDLFSRPVSSISIARDAQGAPYVMIEGQQMFVSFAGRSGWSLIGLARHPIGVDLEAFNPNLEIPFNLLRADERAMLHAAEPNQAQAFLRLWTLKEAIAKALRKGLFLPPEAIRLQLSSSLVYLLVGGCEQVLPLRQLDYAEIRVSNALSLSDLSQFGLASVTLES